MFWSRLGITLADLDEWPEAKVRRWRLMMEQVALYEEKQAELARQRAALEAKKK